MAKVSVVIPTYNRSKFLSYAILSVLQQPFSDFELIICDDASKDDTAEMVGQLNDSRIRYIQHPQNIGRSRNMRSGFEAATGDYFIKFDDDDALTPDFLAKTVAVLDSCPEIDFVCTNHWIIDGQGERIQSATEENASKWGKDKLGEGKIFNLVEQTFRHQSLQVGSTLFRRDCLEEVDFMRPEADGCEDFDLLVRLALAGKKGYFLPEYLMEYRLHGGQTSLKQDIHFLSAKLYCVEGYSFSDNNLEKIRVERLAELKQGLGLRLIENRESEKGRKLLRESVQISGISKRAILIGLISYLPWNIQQTILQSFRKVRKKDYSQKVRERS